MKEIIAPISRELLKSELTEDKRMRFTNRSHNEIYVVTWQNAPNVVKEIGRLREIAFRAAGGGTGKDMDLDELMFVKTHTNNSLCGILTRKKSLEAIAICWAQR